MMQQNSPTILVIGMGFLGSPLADFLARDGFRVLRASFSAKDEVFPCDLGNAESIRQLASVLPNQPDFIIHCASSGRGLGIEAYHSVYRLGTAHLLEFFPNSRLIFTSSTSVYGQSDGSWVDEQSATAPPAETGKVLLQAESQVLKKNGLVLRLAGLYGPKRSYLLTRFLAGEAIMEEGGKRFLNQIHRDDAISAITFLLRYTPFPAGRLFNLCDSKPMTQKELYQCMSERFHLPMPPDQPKNLQKKRGWSDKRVSNAALCHLGWEPNFPDYPSALDSIYSSLTQAS